MPDTIVAEIRKNTREVIRVQLQEFQGRPIASIRVWFEAADGSYRPGKDGLNFKVELLQDLAEGIQAAADAVAAQA